MSDSKLHITFVCTGNICRSPMAEKMFAHQITERGLDDSVRVTSAGTAGWHIGKSADERANRVLLLESVAKLVSPLASFAAVAAGAGVESNQ